LDLPVVLGFSVEISYAEGIDSPFVHSRLDVNRKITPIEGSLGHDHRAVGLVLIEVALCVAKGTPYGLRRSQISEKSETRYKGSGRHLNYMLTINKQIFKFKRCA
jgi:hypothetical protein